MFVMERNNCYRQLWTSIIDIHMCDWP